MKKRDNFYPNHGRTEPDMRQEMINFLDGKFPEIAKKQPALLRKMRRDASGNLVACECTDAITHEPDKDTFCPICHGDGFKWDEVLIDVYSVRLLSSSGKGAVEVEYLTKSGLVNAPLTVFYTRSTLTITDDDKVVEMVLTDDGQLAKPYKRKHLYRIGAAVDLRSDNGKLEYWKLGCYSEKRKFLNR